LVISAAVFLVGGIVLGRRLSPALVGLIDRLQTRGSLLLVSLIVAFGLSYVAVAIQLEAILGAFVAGLILAETTKRHELETQIKPIADLLVPVFFVVVGARTDVGVLNPFNPVNREGLIIAAFLVVVAIVGKVVTGFAVFGLPGINRWAIGVGMIPRGEVGLVFAAYGATTGALSPALQAAVIVMVIVTTFVAPPLLRWAFGPDVAAPEVAASDAGG
jgi:Kef-type K+ transport system membrane component KefB